MVRRPRLALGAALLAVAMVVPAAPAAAAAPQIRFEASLESPCVYGTGPKRAIHVFSIRDADGRLKARTRTRSASDGSFSMCALGTLALYPQPGDLLRVKTSTRRTQVRVPNLRMTIDRDADTIRGRGPADARLDVVVVSETTGQALERRVRVGADRRWTLDLAGRLDILGGDQVGVHWQQGRAGLSTIGMAPVLAYSPQGGFVSGARDPGQQAKVRLVDTNGKVRARASVMGLSSIFMGLLEDAQGRAVTMRPGDRVISNVAGGVNLRVPAWQLRADVSDRRVSGRCMPNSPYRVVLDDSFSFWMEYDDSFYVVLTGTTGPDGRFSRKRKLRLGVDVQLECRYPSGDRIIVSTDVQP